MRLINPSFKIMQHLEYAQMLRLTCQAISNCYKAQVPSTQKERELFIESRIKLKHESVLEHVGFSVTFIVDRGITHELVRHRLASFTQSSTRYCNFSKDKFGGHCTFILPPFMQAAGIPEGEFNLRPVVEGRIELVSTSVGDRLEGGSIPIEDPAAILWISVMAATEDAYLTAVANEKPGPYMVPEIARGMLPNSLAAEITMTCNMREWRHVFKLRALGLTGNPHPQMKEVMRPLLVEAAERFPVFFRDLTSFLHELKD